MLQPSGPENATHHHQEFTNHMSDMDPNDVDHIDAYVWLLCKNGHRVGHLHGRRGMNRIEHKRAGQPDPPDYWPLNKTDIYSEPVCPGGCQHEVGDLAERLVEKVITLVNDSRNDHDIYVLKFLGPPQTSE
jgi:hypothetical protein